MLKMSDSFFHLSKPMFAALEIKAHNLEMVATVLIDFVCYQADIFCNRLTTQLTAFSESPLYLTLQWTLTIEYWERHLHWLTVANKCNRGCTLHNACSQLVLQLCSSLLHYPYTIIAQLSPNSRERKSLPLGSLRCFINAQKAIVMLVHHGCASFAAPAMAGGTLWFRIGSPFSEEQSGNCVSEVLAAP